MKLFLSERAASEVIGHVIILSITILGISMLTIFGVPAIYSLQDLANAKNAEQAFTVLDSRASRVTLGDSPLQITNINLGGGSLTVEPNSTGNPSYIVINSSSFNIILPMGRVKYALGERTVAYEGGGVWAQYPGGGSVMLSPPEIHYNGVTLTLPVINISGNASVGGKGTATISIKKIRTTIQYPHPNFMARANPVNDSAGKVFVNITSDYYLAWADYARSLGYTEVTTNSTTHAANIELRIVPSTLGESTSITDPITFRGLDASDTTPLENFSFKLKNVDSNFNWQLSATSGTKTMIIEIKKGTDIGVGYRDTGKGYSEPAEVWTKTDAFFKDADNDVIADLLNETLNLTYVTNEVVGTATGTCIYKINNNEENSTGGFSWGSEYLTGGTTKKSLFEIIQHYIWLMSQSTDVSFYQCSPAGKHGPNAAGSTLLIDYNATGALTYLHITENRADVGIS
ncbi:MAG: hypothetical protein WC556_05510 [Candidatus Methanoperedens sp.]